MLKLAIAIMILVAILTPFGGNAEEMPPIVHVETHEYIEADALTGTIFTELSMVSILNQGTCDITIIGPIFTADVITPQLPQLDTRFTLSISHQNFNWKTINETNLHIEEA